MATITRENISTLHDKINVTVSASDYNENFEKSLKNYSKNANMPGFRKGMVPTGLVKKMYGQSIFTDEVLKTVEKSLYDYLENEKLEIFAQPTPADENDAAKLDCNNPKDYTFGFEIGLKPEINIPALSNANITDYEIIITDEMVNNEIERLQSKMGTMSEPETVDNKEIVLNVNFTPSNQNGETEECATAKDNSLLVKYFTPVYQEKLMGKKNNDTIIVLLNDAFETKELEFILQDLGLAKDGGNVYYNITITKVGLVTPRVLDETFFTETFPNKDIKTLEEAKDILKTDIAAYWKNQTTNQLQDGIYHYWLDNTTFDLPENFLKKWMQTGRDKPYTIEEVETEFPQFTTSLKWTIISDTLNKANGFKVEKEEIKNFALQQVMGYMGITTLDESHGWLHDYANKMMNDKKFIEETYHRVLTEKLFGWATTQVKPVMQQISVEDFTKLISEHKH